ncbi:MAG: hypothetical protein C3F02_04440 [Parcubacteria group bacterium]|nr:MAG: hypothetical protein C3F02_04440 [Parcubacteria group bacterium]
MPAKKIAILSGGTSSERKIALLSARTVLNLLKSKFSVCLYDFPRQIPAFLRNYKKYDIAVPIFHGSGGEDGVVQGFLRTLKIPFVFSDTVSQAIGIDKIQSKLLARSLKISTPDYILLKKNKPIRYRYPVIVKPIAGGSSLGVSLARTAPELKRAIKVALQYKQAVVVEDYIPGDEYSVSVVEYRGKTIALPVIAIISKKSFFDYQSKYDPTLAKEICPASINKTLSQKLQRSALDMHLALGARHLSRSDFIVSKNRLYFLEINTIPGLTKNSLIPKSLRAANIDFLELFQGWMEHPTR